MKNLIIRDGTSQAMRALPALQDGYFNLDEMSFHDLLAMVCEFATLVRFYNAENQPEGNWAPFFAADETVVMSRILAFDSAAVVAQFDHWWRATPEHTGSNYGGRRDSSAGPRSWDVRTLPVAALADTINKWYLALLAARSDNGLALRMLIESVIAQLRADKSGLLARLQQQDVNLQLAPVWQAPAGSADIDQDDNVAAEAVPAQEPELTKAMVRTDFHAFIKAIEMIRKEALTRLPASLQSQQHDPAVAMLIAFVRQFQTLKGKLNHFTQNYLDFYYDKMLGCTPLASVPDRTWLVLRKNAVSRDVLVPGGTEFLAGLDADSRDILYVAAHDLVVSDARVTALQTLYFDHNRYSSPENLLSDEDDIMVAGGAQRTWPTGAWYTALPLQAAAAIAGSQELQPYPLLGAPKNNSGSGSFSDARIGFALASKVLLLKEGRRQIWVNISFDNDVLVKRLELLAMAMRGDGGNDAGDTGDTGDRSDRITATASGAGTPDGTGSEHGQNNPDGDSELEEIRRKDIFIKVFRSIFSVDITGEHGWLTIAQYEPFFDGQVLRLRIELPPQEPAVVAYDTGLHGENYALGTPLLRFVINPGAYLYPYGMLHDLPINGARIEVQVSGARDLVLHNNIGPLSASAPFAPFGPLPTLGSYLLIGSTEMAGKQISGFSVELEWANLPRLNGGFTTYYDGYPQVPANGDFLATVGVLAKGAWAPVNEQSRPTLSLFRTQLQPGQGERLDSRIQWNCDSVTHLFEPDAGVSVQQPLTYSPGAKNGFFKFTLAAPSFAFGHVPYPQALSATLVYNARLRLLRRQRTVPRAPYTPQINAISISYRAASTIELDHKAVDNAALSDQFIHLYPSGWEALNLASYPAPALLPGFDYAGNLYVGIDARELGGTLRLLFQLREDSLPLPQSAPGANIDAVEGGDGSGDSDDSDAVAGNRGGLHWFYLCANEWKPLPKSSLLSDSTQNFMTSGIVTLALPPDMRADNSVMPAGSYWLRLSADRDLDKYCSLYAVHAQALEVQRGATVSAQVPMVLPAATISRSKKPLPGITAILQPLPSVGGRAAETRSQLRMRISERLRHKNRAVSAADYEALILQYFPEVYKVKCFANLAIEGGPADCIRPGHVLVVPLPYWPLTQQQNQMPLLNGNLMQEVQRFLQQLASQWSRIAVENPVYERIQVRCKVKFNGPLGNGHYLSQLNQAISDFLTPWQETCGYRTHFGWRIRQHDLEAFIGELPYVDGVSGFSMLRIASADSLTYTLFDSAAVPVSGQGQSPAAGADQGSDITPLCPWSIALPVVRHAIDVIDDNLPHGPTRTVLGSLEIGSTFIISENDNGQQINDAA